MIRTVLASMLFSLATITSGQAACTSAALAGTWVLGSGSSICQVAISSSGVMTKKSGTCIGSTGKVKITSACVISGSFAGTTFTGRTEYAAPGTSVLPNIFIGYLAGDDSPFVGYRKP